jgi:site-specific recombinase XerD
MSTFRELATTDQNAESLTAELNRIYQRAQEETLALLQSRPTEPYISPVREWMKATQLAEDWQLYNHKNEMTTAGILKVLKWAKWSPDQFPLPHAYMGDLLRFNRDEVTCHTFSTRLRANGVHEWDIRDLLGHASVRMTSVYTHQTPANLCQAVKTLGQTKLGKGREIQMEERMISWDHVIRQTRRYRVTVLTSRPRKSRTFKIAPIFAP